MCGSALEPHNPGKGSIDQACVRIAACFLFQRLCLQAIGARNVRKSVVRFRIEVVVSLRLFPRCLGDFQTPSKMLTVVAVPVQFQAARQQPTPVAVRCSHAEATCLAGVDANGDVLQIRTNYFSSAFVVHKLVRSASDLSGREQGVRWLLNGAPFELLGIYVQTTDASTRSDRCL